MINRILTVFFYGSMAYCLFIITGAVFSAIGPVLEKRVLPPVLELYVVEARCSGADVVMRFYLDKRRYPGDVSAETISFNVRTNTIPAESLATESPTEGSFTAPAGKQIRGVLIKGSCNQEFRFRTRHQSPITGFPLVTRFGPFGPYEPDLLYRRIGGAMMATPIDPSGEDN